jgi:thioredoxin-like negative regulator of GroEL
MENPGEPWTYKEIGLSTSLVLLGRDEEAIRALVNALDANPKNTSPHAFLATAYALLGRSEEARAALAAYLERRPGSRVSTFRTQSPVPLALTSTAYRQLFARVHEGLRKSGMPE